MRRRWSAIAGVVFMAAVLVLYFGLAGVRAVALLSSGTPIAIAMGAALIVLPAIGIWALYKELRFGYLATKLTDTLSDHGEFPVELGERLETGKFDADRAEEVFPQFKEAAETDPENWQNWMRLGIVYDAARDRSRARSAIRTAIKAYKSHQTGQ